MCRILPFTTRANSSWSGVRVVKRSLGGDLKMKGQTIRTQAITSGKRRFSIREERKSESE